MHRISLKVLTLLFCCSFISTHSTSLTPWLSRPSTKIACGLGISSAIALLVWKKVAIDQRRQTNLQQLARAISLVLAFSSNKQTQLILDLQAAYAHKLDANCCLENLCLYLENSLYPNNMTMNQKKLLISACDQILEHHLKDLLWLQPGCLGNWQYNQAQIKSHIERILAKVSVKENIGWQWLLPLPILLSCAGAVSAISSQL